MENQKLTWDVFADKKFSTPLPDDSFLKNLDRNIRILDFGCGHGRLISLLNLHGFKNITGVEDAPGLLNHAKNTHPYAEIIRLSEWIFPKSHFDLVFCLGVLGCIHPEKDLILILEKIYDSMKSAAIFYVEDFLLNGHEPYSSRYKSGNGKFEKFGIWRHRSGILIRHFNENELLNLLKKWQILEKKNLKFTTMNGHQSKGIKLILKKPVCSI